MNQADLLVKNIKSSKEFESPVNKESLMKNTEHKMVRNLIKLSVEIKIKPITSLKQ
jgi:hypothetical protein